MEIEDAFTQEAIALTDTNVEGDEESKVREMIRAVYKSNEVELSDDHENIAILMFVAGRAYQEGKGFQITLTRPLVASWIEFLQQQGERHD